MSAPTPPRTAGRFAGLLLVGLVGLAGLIGLAGLLVLGATPAGAVTPRPTDSRSTVRSVDPAEAAAVVHVQVIGGDALLEVTVDAGHEVVVDGYVGEPYLRIQADGSVQANRRSPAVALNRTRDPGGTVPADADAAAAPDWVPVAGHGRVTWHDHRIHASSSPSPEPIEWTIDLAVDGQPAVVHGVLRHLPSPSPLPYLAGAVLIAGLAHRAGRRRGPAGARRVLVLALLVAALVAGATGAVEWAALPVGVARNAGLFVLPLGAGLLAIGATWSRRPTVRMVTAAAAVALLSGWLAFRWSILVRAVLIGSTPPVLDRAGYALVAGLSIAAAFLVIDAAGPPPTRRPGAAGRRRPPADRLRWPGAGSGAGTG